MRKVVIALDKYDSYANSLEETKKFLLYDIVDGEITQLSLASVCDSSFEEKVKFLQENKVKALFIIDIGDLEFVKIPSFGLHVITSFDSKTLYTQLVNNYIHNNYDEDEFDSIEEYRESRDVNIIPPLSSSYMQQLPLEIGDELVDLHLNNIGNGEGGFKEK